MLFGVFGVDVIYLCVCLVNDEQVIGNSFWLNYQCYIIVMGINFGLVVLCYSMCGYFLLNDFVQVYNDDWGVSSCVCQCFQVNFLQCIGECSMFLFNGGQVCYWDSVQQYNDL